MYNQFAPILVLLLILLTTSISLQAQSSQNSFADSTTTASSPQAPPTQQVPTLVKPREVRVKDAITRKRFWLVYHNHQELMALRKAGFVILRTRRIRDPSQSQAWQNVLKDLFVVVIQAGAPVLLRRSQTTSNASQSGGGG